VSLAKSLYRSCAGSHFYGTEYEIWADFGPVVNTEKKWGADYEQLLMPIFHFFVGKKMLNFLKKHCNVASALKSCIREHSHMTSDF
jgi:hypothetical protein